MTLLYIDELVINANHLVASHQSALKQDFQKNFPTIEIKLKQDFQKHFLTIKIKLILTYLQCQYVFVFFDILLFII